MEVGQKVFAPWKDGWQYPAVILEIGVAVKVEFVDWRKDNVAWVGMDAIELQEGEADGETKQLLCRTCANLALSILVAGLADRAAGSRNLPPNLGAPLKPPRPSVPRASQQW